MRYFDGQLRLDVTDVASGGFGQGWSHRRTFSNQSESSFDRGNGWNWYLEDWPFLLESPFPGSSLLLMGNVNDILWFDEPAPNEFVTLFGRLDVLEYLEISGSSPVEYEYRLSRPDGTVLKFNDFDHPSRPGAFKSLTIPGGNTTTVTGEGADIVEVQRSYTSGGDTITESFKYDFFTSGDNIGRLQFCTLRRNVNGGAWQDVRQAVYVYYGSSESFGTLNDLKTVTRKDWNGSEWVEIDVNYYRYYKSGDANGFEHGLKFVVEPEAYTRMIVAGIDPLTASNATLSTFADLYFEYDFDHRVVKEMTNAGSRTFTFAFTANPHTPPTEQDFNRWARKTVETLPDSSQNIVYTNSAGMTMLEVVQSGSNKWYKFTKYNDDGRPILQAESSAVSGYDDQYDDLLHFSGGSYEYLRNNDGLIHVLDYYTTTGSGAAEGYLQFEKIKKGQAGSELKIRELQYTSHTDSAGVAIFPVSKEITYPSDTNQSIKIETSYSYTYHSGTNQFDQKTTTWPVIATSQNGSGTANSRIDVFDIFGNRTWLKDERGFITRFEYNIQTGAMTQRIDDVDTNQVSGEPAGWTTPAGGGLHLITDFEHDNLGRITQSLGPSHTIDVSGTATTVRTATWTVYKDPEFQTLTGNGYATGSAPSYTYTLINPVSISQFDKNGNVIEAIQAARASTSGKLLPSDSFPRSTYRRWTTNHYTDCCKLEYTRLYRVIPSSGAGSPGTNYDQTDFGYDVRDRRNRVVTPGGTITRTVFDVRSLPTQIWVGTDDTGATASNPAGSGAPNNMVQISGNEYDGGTAGGDGNLTQVTQYVDGSTTRVTNFLYDWRNRQTATDGEVDFYSKSYYDNLDRTIKTERYDTTSSGNLIALAETKFDDLSRVYQSIRYGVNPSNGAVGNSLTDNVWYDPSGNVLKQFPAGANLFTKSVYDGINRPQKQFLGYDTAETSYADAGTVTGDTILEQTETTYDAASNGIQTVVRQRYHNATGTGELTSPSGAQPKARVLYAAAWQDGIGRVVAAADYGTNGGSALSRPATIPSRSDTVLVTMTEFNDAAEPYKVTDPAGTLNRLEFDHAGRRIKLIENYIDGNPDSDTTDQDRTTLWTYNADGNVNQLTAKNGATGDQNTIYAYGTTLSNSAVASNLLLRSEAYPDSSGSSDVIQYKYNRQGQVTERQDQNATVRMFDYDALGRLMQDRVTTLGATVDFAIRRIATTYEVRGMPVKTTSYDNASVGFGNIANEVLRTYNSFGQLTNEYQSHSGAVDTGSTPRCQYAYADGSANHVRPTSMTYPHGRILYDNYGSSGGIDDNAGRIAALVDSDGSTHLADYSYLGAGTIVEVDEPQPDLKYTLVGTAGGDDPDTGDIYRGLDRFGRVKDLLWRDYGASADAVRILHGYDRASNRLWREDPVAAASTQRFDEFYTYDGLYRLKHTGRGTLNAGHTGLTARTFAQQWLLDATGNWVSFQQEDAGSGVWDRLQFRMANPANEIALITPLTGPIVLTPTYNAAGNMTSVPQSPPLSWSELTLGEWSGMTLDQWSTMVLSGGYAATYDAWNRLVKLEQGGSVVQENGYDGRNFRVTKRKYMGGSNEMRHLYYSSAWQVLEERVAASSEADRQYVWGLKYLDDLILRHRDADANGILDEILYSLQDPNWNVVAVANSSGDVVERFMDDAYGLPNVLTPSFDSRASSSYGWETRYAGYRWDEETHLYVVRNRILHPTLGVWLQRDPIRYHDGNNLYEYLGSRVLYGTDLFGEQGPAAHHGYHLYLGGANNAPVWNFTPQFGDLTLEKANIGHKTATNYMRSRFPFGGTGAKIWGELSEIQQKAHVSRSLRKSFESMGMESSPAKVLSRRYLDEIMAGAIPGKNRTCERDRSQYGPLIRFNLQGQSTMETQGQSGGPGHPRGGFLTLPRFNLPSMPRLSGAVKGAGPMIAPMLIDMGCNYVDEATRRDWYGQGFTTGGLTFVRQNVEHEMEKTWNLVSYNAKSRWEELQEIELGNYGNRFLNWLSGH